MKAMLDEFPTLIIKVRNYMKIVKKIANAKGVQIRAFDSNFINNTQVP